MQKGDTVMLNLNDLVSDFPCSSASDTAYCDPFVLDSHGSHIYGEVYVPDPSVSGPHPCICLFHGFPGFTNNDDLAQALRRTGCVVIRIHHRGAWGSEGYYSFTNNIEDAIGVVNWVLSPASDKYDIDPDNIFLAGHSMGGQTALNAARVLPQVRGTILIAPYNMAYCFRTDRIDEFTELMKEGFPLRLESPDSLFENASAHWQETDFEAAFEDVKEKNLLLIEAAYDTVASYEKNAQSFWERIEQHSGSACQDLVFLEGTHSFCSCRIQLARTIAEWIQKVLS